MNACMKIGIGKAGKIMYPKFQEGVTPISDLWLKPETIAEYLLHIPPDRKIDITSMCQNSAGRLHHDRAASKIITHPKCSIFSSPHCKKHASQFSLLCLLFSTSLWNIYILLTAAE
jgi:hypothetical protein